MSRDAIFESFSEEFDFFLEVIHLKNYLKNSVKTKKTGKLPAFLFLFSVFLVSGFYFLSKCL